MAHDRVLTIYVMGSDSKSPKSVSIRNRTRGSFISSREHFPDIKNRPELEKPAVYFLVGETNDEGATSVYIGETDDFSERVKDHLRKKDWWQKFVVFHSNDFTKADVKFLERELLVMAKKSIGTLIVTNDKDPSGTSLPEHQIAATREIKDDIVFILETLGLIWFDSNTKDIRKSKQSDNSELSNISDDQTFYMTLPKDLSESGDTNLRATMCDSNGSYILKAGSIIKKVPHASLGSDSSYAELWKQIINSDSVKKISNAKVLETTRDIEFKSPSAAGAVVRARPTNGRTDWKRVTDDVTFHEASLELLGKPGK